MNLLINIRIKKAAAIVLIKELGTKRLLKILPKMSKRKREGQPWQDMPQPQNKKDIESRQLIGEAILLYRELLNILSQTRAEEIVRKVIIESAVKQLYTLVPKLSKEKILVMSQQERKEKFSDIISQFPNAEWQITKAEGKTYCYDITRCRLVELIIATGHTELKDAFCAGDGIYFERHQPDIDFDRPKKIGSGDKVCQFNFKIKN